MKLKDETLGNEKLHGSVVGPTDPVWGQITGDIQDQEDLIELIDSTDEQLQANIDTVAQNLSIEMNYRASEVKRLDNRVDTEIQTRKSEITQIDSRIDQEIEKRQSECKRLDERIDTEEVTRAAEDKKLYEALTTETESRKNRDSELQRDLDNEITNRISEVERLDARVSTEAARATKAETQLQSNIDTEVSRALKAEQTETESRLAKDTDLQNQIDSINARSDVVDVVGTKQELIDYDKPLTVNDIVKVLKDESYNNATTYYRYIEEATFNKLKSIDSINTSAFLLEGTTYTWSLVGSIGPYYTTAEADKLLAAEKAAREAADLLLQSNLDTEKATRISEVARLDKRIDDETTRAKEAENTLTTNLNTEVVRAKEAEKVLTDNLNSEIDRATKAESNITADLVSEIARAKNVEATLIADINTEIQNRTFADNALQTSLNDEITRATEAEKVLTANLSSEIARAKSAEAELTTNLTSETSRAKSAEKVLTDNLDTEVKRAEAAENTLTNNLSAEVTRAKDAENTLTTNLTAEITRAKNAEAELTTNLGAEVANRENADATIQTALDSEIDRAKQAEVKLTNDLSTEVSRAEAAENTLTTNLTNEINRAKQEESTISTNLADEIARAEKVEDALSTSVSTETDNRVKADTNLQTQIDAINSRSDVVDVVATKAELDAYDKDITIDDIIKVLQDETQDNATSYYRNIAKSKPYVWELIGKIGPYYTQAQTDTLINDEVTARTNADETLQNNINDEVSRAQGVEASLQDKISAETERAKNVESGKQETLVSGTNIKTINNESILGSGNIEVKGGVTSITAANGLTGGTITSEGTIGLETKTVSSNRAWLEIDEYGRVVDSLENYKQYYEYQEDGWTFPTIFNSLFFNYTTDPDADDIASMYSSAQYAGTLFSIVNIYDSDNNLSKVSIYIETSLFMSFTTFNRVSSFSEIASTMSEKPQLYIYDKLGLYIMVMTPDDEPLWYVFYHEPAFDGIFLNTGAIYAKLPKGCTTIYQYDISDIDLVEEAVALLYDSTNSKMYKYKKKWKYKQEYTFGGYISDLSKVTAGNFTYYIYQTQVGSGGGKYINYMCYLFSDAQADVGYDIYNVVLKTTSTKLSNLTDGQSIVTGTDIDTIVNNGFYHQVGDWTGTLPSVDGIEWHYSNLLAFNAGVDVTVQMLFPFNSSACYAYRTGRGNPLAWQSWSVVAPNTYATTTYVDEQIGAVINADY